jgi:Cys-rich protein (TIGR01571 family)
MSLLYVPDDFNTGLCECCDDQPSCMSGFFCPWCALSAQFNMLMNRRTGVAPHVCLPLVLINFLLWGGFGVACFSVLTRNMMRRSFLLSAESEANSCFKAFFCVHLSICQVYREMSIRHEAPGGPCGEGDEPYAKAGLVVPPPNPERMGELVQPARTTSNANTSATTSNHTTTVGVRPHQPQPFHTAGREGDEVPAFGDAAPRHPLKPVYGYES